MKIIICLFLSSILYWGVTICRTQAQSQQSADIHPAEQIKIGKSTTLYKLQDADGKFIYVTESIGTTSSVAVTSAR